MARLLWVLIGCSLLVLDSSAATRRKHRTTRHRTAESQILDASIVNNAQWNGEKDPGPWLLRAQILLARAHFSPGEIDGKQGDNFQRALTGFQRSRSLQPTGEMEQQTWAALTADANPAIIPYTIAIGDVAGPFTKIPQDMTEQAKLPAMGYQSPEEALGERFHMSPGLLKRLNPDKSFTAGDQIQVVDVGAAATGKASRITITKAGVLTVFGSGDTVIAQYPCSSGSEHDPLPIGDWKVKGVKKNPDFFYNPQLFWDAKPEESKAKIAPGPNNPVGVVWIDLTKEHYGIHGTPSPALVGHTQSHGCIRLTNWDALELAGMVGPGTPVKCEE